MNLIYVSCIIKTKTMSLKQNWQTYFNFLYVRQIRQGGMYLKKTHKCAMYRQRYNAGTNVSKK